MTPSQIRRIAIASVLALIGLVGCSLLGVWQYSRAHRDDIAKQVLTAAPVAVQELVQVGQYVPENHFARDVRLTGAMDLAQSLLTCGRTERGVEGCWVIAPVAVTARTASTAVLGFVPDSQARRVLQALRALGSVPSTLQGRLQPAEVMDRGHAILRPTTRVPYINVNELALRWKRQLFDGYVIVDGQPRQPGLAAISAPLILPPSGITWRNLFYAWQWWAFAGFVLFLLVRYILDVREEATTLADTISEEQQ